MRLLRFARNDRRVRLILFFILALAIMPARTFSYQGDIEDIGGSKYFPAVQKAISEARESVYMAMPLITRMPRPL